MAGSRLRERAVAMHTFSARPSGGNKPAGGDSHWLEALLLFLLSSSLVMSAASKLAATLNSWAKEGRDTLGGANGVALEELISEVMDRPGSEAQPPECKS